MALRTSPRELARVLEEDPELAELLDPSQLARANELALARTLRLSPGEWPPFTRPDTPLLGLLVLEGLLGNRVALRERSHLELVGPGDLLRPWVGLGAGASQPVQVKWRAFADSRLAVLDRRFSAAIRDFPEIHEVLSDRFVLRARRLGFQLAVNSIVGVPERVLIVLWHYADRWGHVTREGITLDLPLSHQDLADVVGSSRPTVTSALTELRHDGRIEIRPGEWLLLGSAPARFAELHEAGGIQCSGDGRLAGSRLSEAWRQPDAREDEPPV